MAYVRDLSPGKQIALAWSGGYLSSRGYIGEQRGTVYLEIKQRGAYDELHRFAKPLDDLHMVLREVQHKGHPCTSLNIRGENLHKAMERLWPHLTVAVRDRYTTTVHKALEKMRKKGSEDVA